MTTREAVARADALLLERLSPEQREDYRRSRSFLVVTPGGRRYRLHADRVNYQADLLALESEFVLAQYCVQPAEAGVPKSDSLLTQMLLLQSDEARFLLTANETLFVPHLHKYLNGELQPPAPRTPEHEPTNAFHGTQFVPDESGWHIPGLIGAAANSIRRTRRQTAEQQITADYRCATHQTQVCSITESPDGRGWRVRYDCDCPTQYVSFRAHEQRQRQLQVQATEEHNNVIRALMRQAR